MNEANSLRLRLFLIQGIILALFCLLVTAGVSVPLYRQLSSDLDREFTTGVKRQAAAACQWILRAKEMARQIASRTRIRQELQKYNQGLTTLDQLVEFTAPKLKDALRLSNEIAGVTRRDARGAVVLSLGVKPPDRALGTALPSPQKVDLGRPFKSRGNTYIWVQAPITDRSGGLVGSDMLTINAENLKKVIRFTPPSEGKADLWGSFLVYPRTGGFEPAASELHNAGRDRPADLVDEILATAYRQSRGGESTRFKLKGLFCVTAPVDGSSWMAVTCLDEDLINAPIIWNLAKVLLLALLIYVLCLFGFWLALSPISRRIFVKHSELESEIEAKTDSLRKELEARKQAEKSLAEERQRLDYIIRGTNVGTWEWNVQTGETVFNERWAHFIGYRLVDLSPVSIDTWNKLVHPDDVKISEGQLERHFAGESAFYECEVRMRHKNGDWIWVLDRGKVATWTPDGKPLLMFGTHQDITERKNAEEALRESEIRLKALSAASFEAIFLSENGICLDQNETAERMFGYTLEEAIGRYGTEWILPRDRELVKSNMLEGHIFPYEVTALRKDGSTFPCEIQARMIDYQGRKIRVTALRDITERKLAEKALRESEAQLARAQEIAHLGHWDWDMTGGQLQWSDETYRIFGLEPQEFGATYEAFLGSVHPEDRAEVVQAVDLAIHKRQPYNLEHRVVRKTGEIRVVHELGEVSYGGNGEPLHMVGTVQDITERKRAEEALKESEERLRTLINATPDIICFKDGQGRWLEANNADLELFALTEADYKGLTDCELSDYTDPIYREAFLTCEASDENAWMAERISQNEEAIPQKDGGHKIYDVIKVPLFENDGGRKGLIVLGRDITERKRAEEEKERLAAQLRQAQKMEAVGTLAGGIAHDFNNILAAISGYSELALDEALRGKPSPQELEQILKAADRAKGLVQQILTFSREMSSESKPLKLNKVVSEAQSVIERTIPKMIHTEFHLEDGLPLIKGDAAQIESIILNLATNARDAMPEGGRLTIQTETAQVKKGVCSACGSPFAGQYVLVRVSDTGHGIDQSISHQIFDPFFTTKEVGKGTGLGMSTVFGIVSEHGGHIICKSEPGLGAVFEVYFPVFGVDDNEPAPEGDSNEELRGGNESILLVDDEAALRRISQMNLRKQGYKVASAASGEEALELYRDKQTEFDLVVLDIGMPGMGGRKCLRELLSRNPAQKVLIASGYAASDQVEDTLALGASGFIAKPFRKGDLLKMVRQVLDA